MGKRTKRGERSDHLRVSGGAKGPASGTTDKRQDGGLTREDIEKQRAARKAWWTAQIAKRKAELAANKKLQKTLRRAKEKGGVVATDRRKHLIRSARFDRLLEIARATGDQELKKEVLKLREKERERHALVMFEKGAASIPAFR